MPLVIAPLGRDQPDNAARVVHAEAGLRVRKNASIAALQAAVARVLDDDRYRARPGAWRRSWLPSTTTVSSSMNSSAWPQSRAGPGLPPAGAT